MSQNTESQDIAYRELYREGAGYLSAVLKEEREAQLDARLLLEYICGTDLQTMLMDGEMPVSKEDAAAYREGHLEDALNLPLDTIIEDAEEQFEDRAVMLYVYGKDPEESCAGAQKLTDAGFTSVAEVGSYDDWISYHAESETEGLMQGRLE